MPTQPALAKDRAKGRATGLPLTIDIMPLKNLTSRADHSSPASLAALALRPDACRFFLHARHDGSPEQIIMPLFLKHLLNYGSFFAFPASMLA